MQFPVSFGLYVSKKSWKSMGALSPVMLCEGHYWSGQESYLPRDQHPAMLFSYPFPIVDSADH
jgi:hypothetical protein